MIVGFLTTCHIQYTWDRSICIFLFNRTTLPVFVTYLIDALYVHPLWFYKHQHDNRFGSKLFVACNNLQFRDTCGKRRNINLVLDVTPQKEITWGCIWRTRCIVYDKLLKPRQSFWINLYFRNHLLSQTAFFQCRAKNSLMFFFWGGVTITDHWRITWNIQNKRIYLRDSRLKPPHKWNLGSYRIFRQRKMALPCRRFETTYR